jgi:hypothetical protein
VALGRCSPSTSVIPANLHSTNFTILTVTRGRYYRPEVQKVEREIGHTSCKSYNFQGNRRDPYAESSYNLRTVGCFAKCFVG